MKRRILTSIPWALALLATAAVSQAQGNITDGAATFRRTGTPFDTTPTADLVGVSSTLTADHLAETGWWFRVAGDTQESFFPAPNAQVYNGNKSTIDWDDVNGRGLFRAREVSLVRNVGGPSGFVIMTMQITNLSPTQPLTIDIFHMADFDLQPTPGDDLARLLYRHNHMRLSDAGGNVAEYRGVGAKAYLVRPLGATDPSAVLSDAAVTNFDNTGLPFGPGDFTGGFQWSYTLAPSANRSFTAVLGANLSLVRGDFNDDGETDLLFRNSAFTQHSVWTMNDLTRIASVAVTPDVADPNQRAVCTEDFSGDSRTDIVFWNQSTGSVEFWTMGGPTGTTRQGVLPLQGTAPLSTDWNVAACGDVDGDGNADILWRNVVTQKLKVWLMDNDTWQADRVPTPSQAVDGNWAVVALLDFNGDGAPDLHWYNSTSGSNVHWFMDQNLVRVSGQFTTPPNAGNNNWKVVAAGDYGQGSLGAPPVGAGDVIFRNETSGRIVGWIMDGLGTPPAGNTRLEGLFTCPVEVGGGCDPTVPPGPAALGWFIVGPR